VAEEGNLYYLADKEPPMHTRLGMYGLGLLGSGLVGTSGAAYVTEAVDEPLLIGGIGFGLVYVASSLAAAMALARDSDSMRTAILPSLVVVPVILALLSSLGLFDVFDAWTAILVTTFAVTGLGYPVGVSIRWDCRFEETVIVGYLAAVTATILALVLLNDSTRVLVGPLVVMLAATLVALPTVFGLAPYLLGRAVARTLADGSPYS